MPACANGVNHQQEENGTAQYYHCGGKIKGHLATYSTRTKICCMEELNKQCESMGVRWLLSYHSLMALENPEWLALLPDDVTMHTLRQPHVLSM